MLQFQAVCHGVSANALILHQTLHRTPPKVHSTDIYQRSHFKTAQSVPLHPVAGKVFTEAS